MDEQIETTRGRMFLSALDKVEGYENREHEHVLWTEYRVKGDPPLPLDPTLVAKLGRADLREIVRRDCHVILKQPSVVADAIAGGIGG